MKKYTDVHIQFDSIKLIKNAVKEMYNEENKRKFACERNRIDSLDKAVCQLQKQIRSLQVVVNRLDAINK